MRNPTYSIRHFDELPDSARIRGFEFRVLLGVGNSTFYRWLAQGRIPQPSKDKTWSVGEVRIVLGASK